MRDFYYYKNKVNALHRDIDWLANTSWKRASDVATFAVTCVGMSATDIMIKSAADVKNMMTLMSLGTK